MVSEGQQIKDSNLGVWARNPMPLCPHEIDISALYVSPRTITG